MQIMNIESWNSFKALVNTKDLLIQYSEDDNYYYIYAPEASTFLWQITLIKDSGTDVTDFETNFKSSANKPLEYRSEDGLVKVASAKFTEKLGFYLTGATEQLELTGAGSGYIKFHFDDPYTLSGVHAQWSNANFGDKMDFIVGVYTDLEDEGTFIPLSQFADDFKVMDSGSILIDVPTVKTVPPTINLGNGDMDVYIRIKVESVGSNTSRYIINLVGWM